MCKIIMWECGIREPHIANECNMGFYLGFVEIFLSYLATWLHLAEERGDVEATIEVDGRKNHALALDAHHLARSKVGNEEYVLANQLLWLIVCGDT